MRCLRHQRVDHKRFPAWILGNPGSTWIMGGGGGGGGGGVEGGYIGTAAWVFLGHVKDVKNM